MNKVPAQWNILLNMFYDNPCNEANWDRKVVGEEEERQLTSWRAHADGHRGGTRPWRRRTRVVEGARVRWGGG